MVNTGQLARQVVAMGRRLRGIAERALVRIISDDLNRQNLQVQTLADATNDDVERFQNYGLTSVPPAGSEAIVLAIGGQRENLVAIAVEDKRCRPGGLESGEVRLYHADGQSYITLKKNGVIEITGKTTTLTASESLTITTAQLTVNGPSTFSEDVNIAGVSFLPHFHIDSEGGNTSGPKS